jgi:hypothetical protein
VLMVSTVLIGIQTTCLFSKPRELTNPSLSAIFLPAQPSFWHYPVTQIALLNLI